MCLCQQQNCASSAAKRCMISTLGNFLKSWFKKQSDAGQNSRGRNLDRGPNKDSSFRPPPTRRTGCWLFNDWKGWGASVATSEEWVVRLGWTEMSYRYEGWVVVMTLYVREKNRVVLSQCKDLTAITINREIRRWKSWTWTNSALSCCSLSCVTPRNARGLLKSSFNRTTMLYND